jgi:hypothetical protein
MPDTKAFDGITIPALATRFSGQEEGRLQQRSGTSAIQTRTSRYSLDQVKRYIEFTTLHGQIIDLGRDIPGTTATKGETLA